ncbi:MAG: trigger factor [Patescibacteria group bacterium]|nr:trigger factor [Patescibacteria group bacterium]
MKTQIKDLPKSQKEISVEIPVEDMEIYINKALDKMSREIKLDGFRDGKVPKDVVRKKVGEAALFQEASGIAIESSYLKIIKENKLSPLGQPQAEITKAAPGNQFEYKITISVLPEIKLWDYQKISGKIEVKEIKDEMIEEELKTLRKKRATHITKNESANKGDRVEINFESRVGGVKIEGGESKNHPLTIGENKFVPGFEENLIGMKKDDVKEFNLVFPKDYHKKELAEKNASFKVTMNIVQKVELPEINDDFAKGLGKFKDLAELKKGIKEGMVAEEKNRAREEYRNKLIDEIAEKSTAEIPDILIESELEKMINEFKNNITQTGMEFEDYLKNVNTDLEKLKKEWRGMAEKRTMTGLTLREISIKEKIEIEDTEVEERANQALKFYPNEEEIRKKIDMEKFKEHTANALVNEKVFEILEKIAEKNAG